jgi:small subunit ribosomal protein S17
MAESEDKNEEAPVTDGEAAEQPAEEAPEEAALEPTVPAAPAEALTPKERRLRGRAARASATPAKPPQSPEERQQERQAERRRKAALRRSQRQRARAKSRAGERATAATAPREHEPGRQKTRQGVVVSDRADKTITVRIDMARRHRRYEKIVRTSRTLHAHDELNDAHIGDTVIVRESRPLARTKRWRLVEVVERAE